MRMEQQLFCLDFSKQLARMIQWRGNKGKKIKIKKEMNPILIYLNLKKQKY